MSNPIDYILNYVEGTISINEFEKLFLENKDLQRLLKKKFDLSRVAYQKYDFNLFNFFNQEYTLKNNKWDNVVCRYIVYSELVRWLKFFKYSFKEYDKYKEDYIFILNIQPAWLDVIDDQGIFDSILNDIPNDLSYNKKVALGKSKLKELFRYDKSYPKWIQGAEWPIVNGKPLVFSHQCKGNDDGELVRFYFYDFDTKEEVIIEQLY